MATSQLINSPSVTLKLTNANGARLTSITAMVPGVYQCRYSDTTQNYCDYAGNLINYTASAVSAQGQPLSTQTAAPVRLVSINTIAQGVYQCQMSDGSAHYCDQSGNPISYTPPPTTPAVTPASSLPTSAVSPTVQPVAPQPGTAPIPVAITPSGTPVSTVSGTPAPAPATSSTGLNLDLGSILTWLQGSMFGGLPNWLLVGGGALLLMSESGSPPRRRHK